MALACLCWSWISVHELCILSLEIFFSWFVFVLADLKKASSSNAAKSSLPKSGLRPPGYSRLPAAKLAAFGFVRSSSVSSVSSTQSADSAQPEPGRLSNRKWGSGMGGRCRLSPESTPGWGGQTSRRRSCTWVLQSCIFFVCK